MSSALTITREEINEATLLLNVVCPPDLVKDGFSKAIKDLSKQIKIPGFRPGGAPAHLVEQAVGEREILNAAAERIARSAVKKALEQENLTPVSTPVLDLVKFERTTSEAEFRLKVPLASVIEVGEYKGLPVVRPSIEITDADVEEQIDGLRRREGKRETITDRGIENGDMAVVNIKVDGQEGDGRTFMTVVGQTFPDLDAQIIGMKAEEIKHATITFPGNFQEADWANQTHPSTITIRSVNAIKLPELDDDFAKKLKLADVEELRTAVRRRMEEQKEVIQNNSLQEQLMEELGRRSRIVVPTTTWEQVAERRIQEIAAEAESKGGTLEDYAKSQGMEVEGLYEALKREAKLHVERAVMIEHIFREEKMTISADTFNLYAMQVLSQNGIGMEDAPKFLKEYGQQVREEATFRALNDAVVSFLIENAAITEGEAAPAAAASAEDAAPKKKSTKKKAE